MPIVFASRMPRRAYSLALSIVCSAVAISAHAHAADSNDVSGIDARGGATSGAVRIDLRPEVQVHRAQVMLGDVADIGTNDDARRSALAALPLGSAPMAGDVVRIDRATLARWISARAGVAPSALAWSGADTVRVARTTREVAGAMIATRAGERLREWIARDGLQVTLTAARIPPDVAVPDGAVRIEPRRLSQYASDTALLAQHISVWVDLSVDGRFVRTVPVDFDLGVSGPAYVATQPLAAGTALSRSLVRVENVAWTGRLAAPLSPAEAAVPLSALRVRHAFAAGDPLSAPLVEQAPLVARGEWAILRVSDDGVRLESRVQVLDDGVLGARVRVKLPAAHDPIYARVTGRKTVEPTP